MASPTDGARPMSSLPVFVADTHAVVFFLSGSAELGRNAEAAFVAAGRGAAELLVPTHVLLEIQYLEESQRRGIEPGTFARVRHWGSQTPGVSFVAFGLDEADTISRVPRSAVPNPSDRVMCATALARGATLLSRDGEIVAWNGVPLVW